MGPPTRSGLDGAQGLHPPRAVRPTALQRAIGRSMQANPRGARERRPSPAIRPMPREPDRALAARPPPARQMPPRTRMPGAGAGATLPGPPERKPSRAEPGRNQGWANQPAAAPHSARARNARDLGQPRWIPERRTGTHDSLDSAWLRPLRRGLPRDSTTGRHACQAWSLERVLIQCRGSDPRGLPAHRGPAASSAQRSLLAAGRGTDHGRPVPGRRGRALAARWMTGSVDWDPMPAAHGFPAARGRGGGARG
jgi:hypothetical protein